MSVDQIFDRLEQLFKSWTAPEDDIFAGSRRRSSGDSDFDAAMSELDDFLGQDRMASEARAREREARERLERMKAEAARQGGYSDTRPSGPPAAVLEAYRTLGLPVGTPYPEIRAAYKKLLLKYHPDRNTGSPAEQKRATEISARINEAMQVIETWQTTGRVSP